MFTKELIDLENNNTNNNRCMTIEAKADKLKSFSGGLLLIIIVNYACDYEARTEWMESIRLYIVI